MKIVQEKSLDVTYGGAANVAVSLANHGEEDYFVTKVLDNTVGQAAINYLRRYGVKADYVLKGGERLGIFFTR
ncbi:MAG: PfkB family carbohydrate kinase [Thermosediminibacteraceae bacterium]|nr:PfkB family carbohydrate kinase [Thermosediminibacteraceae bacterium]